MTRVFINGASPLLILICSRFPVLQIFIYSLLQGELLALRERVFDAACADDLPRPDLSLIAHAAAHRLAVLAGENEATKAARGFEYWCARSNGVDDVLLVRAARSFLK